MPLALHCKSVTNKDAFFTKFLSVGFKNLSICNTPKVCGMLGLYPLHASWSVMLWTLFVVHRFHKYTAHTTAFVSNSFCDLFSLSMNLVMLRIVRVFLLNLLLMNPEISQQLFSTHNLQVLRFLNCCHHVLKIGWGIEESSPRHKLHQSPLQFSWFHSKLNETVNSMFETLLPPSLIHLSIFKVSS